MLPFVTNETTGTFRERYGKEGGGVVAEGVHTPTGHLERGYYEERGQALGGIDQLKLEWYRMQIVYSCKTLKFSSLLL